MKRIAALAISCALATPIYAQTVATVNGKAITQEQVDQFVKLLVAQGASDSPELRAQVQEEMTNRLAMVQAAEKAGLDKKSEVRQEIELARQGILTRTLMSEYLQKSPVSEADIKKEYDAVKQQTANEVEYQVRHILVTEEQAAKDLLAQIKAKKISFEEAAKKDSIDTGSGAQGGDLGWASSSNYVPEFAQAVESLKKGELAQAPVKSQFGWHIIQVQDTRPVNFPELSAVKDEIENMLRQRKLADYQKKVLSEAKIK